MMWLGFCKSCDICQSTIQKDRVSKVPLGEMPLIDTLFKRVAVDNVGPIKPRSDKKSRYILTMIHYAKKYPRWYRYLALKRNAWRKRWLKCLAGSEFLTKC